MRNLLYCFLIFISLVSFHSAVGATENLTPGAQMDFHQEKLTVKTSGGERHFDIEIAETPKQQEYGLMFRKTLPHDHGMLFIWSKDLPITMWMKNTLIPLDMLFIDATGHIVYIKDNAAPESTTTITAGQPVRAVMELAGGASKEFGIKAGDQVISPYFKP